MKLDFSSLSSYSKFNYCALLIKDRVFTTDDIPVLTIDKYDSSDKHKRALKNFMNPQTIRPNFNQNLEFKPDIKIIKAYSKNKLMELNNLCLVTIKNDKGRVIERRIESRGFSKGKVMRHNLIGANLMIDKSNKRIRLSGPKTCPEWIKIDKI